MTDGLVVAMDGTSGSGKSSTSRGVAARLGLRYLDTGAQFRAMTWWMLRHGVDVHDAAADPVLARCAREIFDLACRLLGGTGDGLSDRLAEHVARRLS